MMIDLRPRLLPALVAGLGVSLLIGAIHLMSSDLPDMPRAAATTGMDGHLTSFPRNPPPDRSLLPGEWARLPVVAAYHARDEFRLREQLEMLLMQSTALARRLEQEPPEIQFSLTDPDR